MSTATRNGLIIAAAIVVGIIGNYYFFGPLGAFVMVSLEFALGLFVMLIYILSRRR